MRLIDADELIQDRVGNDPVRLGQKGRLLHLPIPRLSRKQ